MTDVLFFWITFAAYLTGMFLLVIAAQRRGSERMAALGRGLVWLGLASQTTSIVWRSLLLGTEPLHGFFQRMSRSLSAGPAWQAAVYVLLFVVGIAAAVVVVAFRRRRVVWLPALGTAIVLEMILLDFLNFARLPIVSVYEYLSLASWCAALALLALSPVLRSVVLDAALAVAACLLVVFTAIQPKTIQLELVPALQSYWLFIHVSLTSLGYAVFGISFVVAALLLVKSYEPSKIEPETRRAAWLALGVGAVVGVVVALLLVLAGLALPFREVAYAPHQLEQSAAPSIGLVQLVRYGAALLGAAVTLAFIVFWMAYALLRPKADRSGLGPYLFVVSSVAAFAACLLLAALTQQQERAAERINEEHNALVRLYRDAATPNTGTLSAEAVARSIERCQRLSEQARRVLSNARWLPLTLEGEGNLADDPTHKALVDLYREAGQEWKLPIRYKDIKEIGRSLARRAETTEAVARRLRLPASPEEVQRTDQGIIDEYYRLQAGAPLPRTDAGKIMAFVGIAFPVAIALGLALWLLTPVFRDRLPEVRRLDAVSYRAIAVAYPIFTFGALFAGAIWAHFAWGAWWSWDPKEVGSLVAWVLYTVYLHQRYREALSPRAAAVAAMLGFLAATLSLAGNAFMGGLHAYS